VRLTITDVLQRSQGEVWIAFSTGCGDGTAQWASNRRLAEQGRTHFVEFDINVCLEASMIGQGVSAPAPGFSRLGDDTLVRGILESMDEGGMGYLRISSDCLIMVETRLDPSSIGKMASIRLSPSQLQVTPFDL